MKAHVYSILEKSFVNEIEDVSTKRLWFSDDKLLIVHTDANEVKWNVYTAKLDGTNEVKAFEAKEYGSFIGADDKYIYEDNIGVIAVRKGEADRILRYYDKTTYECLGEINIGRTMKVSFGYGDEKYYFFVRKNADETRSFMYFDKTQIGIGDIEVKEWFNIDNNGVLHCTE